MTGLNHRPQPDALLVDIADYMAQFTTASPEAFSTARYCLMDALGCAMLALQYPACTQLLGPIVPGTFVPNGTRIPGTSLECDPVLGAFDIGLLIRWLDFNDTWLAAEWGHPSDNLGAILSLSDYLSRKKLDVTLHDILLTMIKAYEIQGILALENALNQLGFDHVFFVKVASAASAMHLLGGRETDIINVLSHVFLDGASLRTYRHAPNTGPRKSWAAADATSRGVQLAWWVLQGEMGYPSVLSTAQWGFNHAVLRGNALKLGRPFGSYVMENILFKIAYPAEFHAQTAVECAVLLHPVVKDRLGQIKQIKLWSQSPALRIISKEGPLHNPADRDHCLQYMVAVALIYGDLKAEHYEAGFANNPAIDLLRQKMKVEEDMQYSKDYLDPEKRSIANAIQVDFTDGTSTEKITVEYPLGHKKRRREGIPLLIKKFTENTSTVFGPEKADSLLGLFLDLKKLETMKVSTFLDAWVK